MTSGKTENIQEENLETFSSTQLAPFSLGNEPPSDENTPWNKKAVATIKLKKIIAGQNAAGYIRTAAHQWCQNFELIFIVM